MVGAKLIILTLTIVMPPRVADVDKLQQMDSFEACWTAAKTWVEKDLSDEAKQIGAIGYRASCGFMMKPEEKPKEGDSF